jgi:hypothetical protein
MSEVSVRFRPEPPGAFWLVLGAIVGFVYGFVAGRMFW